MNDNTSATIETLPVIPKAAPSTVRTNSRTRAGEVRPVTRAYTLDESISKPLQALADADCYKCLGTGVKDYRAGGAKARVCKCVLAKQAAAKVQG